MLVDARIPRLPIRRGQFDVVLRYPDPRVLRDFHSAARVHREDRERQALLRAERALRRIEIIIEHLEGVVSLVGIEVMGDNLFEIREFFEISRTALDMAPLTQRRPKART